VRHPGNAPRPVGVLHGIGRAWLRRTLRQDVVARRATPMTSQPAPRRAVHHGHIRASGYWWPASVTPRVQALRRILPLFEAGLQAFETDWGVSVELASPTWIDTQQAPGTPLVRVDEALISAPLTRAEREALGSGARVVLVDAGQVRRLSAEALRAIDLGEAIDVSAFDLQVGM